jgi:ABC-type lipoprotein export system ATPase subunit
MLEMNGISKIYRTDLIETHALRDFSLKVGDGEFVAVTGPSGSGKTTFMNVAGLLETFDTGSYRLDGEVLCRQGLQRAEALGDTAHLDQRFAHERTLGDIPPRMKGS